MREGRDGRQKRNAGPEPLRPAEGRLPPQDLDAEAAVLSAMLLSSDAFDEVQDILQPTHFTPDANRYIYEAVLELGRNNQPIDWVSVASWLRARNRLDQIGGTPYLAQLTDSTPAVAHVAAHALTVREYARLRQLISTCQNLRLKVTGKSRTFRGSSIGRAVDLRHCACDARQLGDAARAGHSHVPSTSQECWPRSSVVMPGRSSGHSQRLGRVSGRRARRRLQDLRRGTQLLPDVSGQTACRPARRRRRRVPCARVGEDRSGDHRAHRRARAGTCGTTGAVRPA